MDFPKTVYKFRNWQNPYHRNTLYNNEIYLASPSDFNDPFDCRIIPNFPSLDTDKKKLEYLETCQAGNPSLTNIDYALNYLDDIIENPDKYEQTHFAFYDTHLAVFCSSIRWDIIPFWSHYANFHTGFCVGFIFEKLKSAFPFSKWDAVKYHEYPSIDPIERRRDRQKAIESSFKMTHYKSEDWEYEKEFRLTRLMDKEMTLQDRLVYLTDDSITEITIGLNFPQFDIPKLKEIATKKNWRLYQARRIPMKFALSREQIQ